MNIKQEKYMNKVEKVYKYIRDNEMFKQNGSVIAGVSGGADSVCLYKILLELRKRLNIEIHVIHINHGIRGEEAKRDEKFVCEMCESDNVPYKVYRYNVPEYAHANSLSEEEAGRILRYKTFEREAYKSGENTVIAVAHNKNDVAETFIHNLCRGSGLKGLTGMECVNGRIVRPVMCLDRREIEEYLEESGYEFITDSTNMSVEYTRNKIRNVILPYLTENINNNSIEHILNAAEELKQAEAYMADITDCMYEKIVTVHNNCIYMDKKAYYDTDDYIRRRVVRKAVGQAAGRLKDITRTHIEDVMGLFLRQSGKYIVLPYGVKAYSDYDKIVLCADKKEEKNSLDDAKADKNKLIVTDVEGEGTYRYGDFVFEIQIIEVENNKDFIKILENYLKNGEKLYTKWFDYDKINFAVQIRSRKEGDYLVINETGNKKKLKKYFADEKIPQRERELIPLFSDGSHIMWVVGHRISEAYKVNSDTKRVMKVTRKDKEDGGQY